MDNKTDIIRQSIIHDMSEGVMTVGFDGKISYINPAALAILERSEDRLIGKAFGACFFA